MYQNATLFVFPSYHEGLPGVVLEAMSCGLPIIATDVRGNRDLISTGENGILVPPRSPRKIAEAITTVIDDETLRKKLGKNARETIEDGYTWDEVSNKFLKCYESLPSTPQSIREFQLSGLPEIFICCLVNPEYIHLFSPVDSIDVHS